MCPNGGILNLDTGLCNQTLVLIVAALTVVVTVIFVGLTPKERY